MSRRQNIAGSTERQSSTRHAETVVHARVGKFRWVICKLLFLACIINYLDRQVLGLLKPDLMKIFGWTEKDYGVIAICFQASYAIGQVAFGPIMNAIGTKATYAFSIAFWSLAAMGHALARTTF